MSTEYAVRVSRQGEVIKVYPCSSEETAWEEKAAMEEDDARSAGFSFDVMERDVAPWVVLVVPTTVRQDSRGED